MAKQTRKLAANSRLVAAGCIGWALLGTHAAGAGLVNTAAWPHEGNISFGSAAASGDVNCDGVADLIVGTPEQSVQFSGDGAVTIWYGDETLPPVALGGGDWVAYGQAGYRGHFGASVAAGDLNGDGCDELIVGAPAHTIAAFDLSEVHVYQGTTSGPTPVWKATGIMPTFSAFGRFGQSVAAADLDGDGYADLIVGEPQASVDDFTNQNQEGAVWVWLGHLGFENDPDGTPANADWMAQSNQAFAHLGESVANAGDVDADGDDEVLAGAPDWNGAGGADEGIAMMWFGSSSFELAANGTPANVGFSSVLGVAGAHHGARVAGIGDVNADGFADILIGAPDFDTGAGPGTGNGFVSGVFGETFGPPDNDVDWSHVGLFANGRLGASLAAAGDVNGDGRADYLVGEPGPRRASLVLGRPTLFDAITADMTYSESPTSYGSMVAGAGDWNGDGFADVIAAAPATGGGSSHAFVYLGSGETVATAINATMALGQAESGLGLGLSNPGDINHDGFSDHIAGAPFWESESGHESEGRVFPLYGGPCGPSCTPIFELIAPGQREANQSGANLGMAAALADVNGDGYADAIAGAPLWDEDVFCNPPFGFCTIQDAGAIFVYMGSADGLATNASLRLTGSIQPGAQFGMAVASAGDVNGDGREDVVVGEPEYDSAFAQAGRAFLFLGSASGLSPTASRVLTGSEAGAHFGVSVAGAGDTNRDGYGDVVIGADGHGVTGAAFLYLGQLTQGAYGAGLYPNPIRSWFGPTGSSFGGAVATAGDVNRDGWSDVVVGAPTADVGGFYPGGLAYVFHGGSPASATPDATLGGEPTDFDVSRFGAGVGAAGDVDGDGYGDLIVGDHWHFGPAGFAQGKAFVFRGSASGIVTSPVRTLADCPTSFCDFGHDVAGTGDVNGDGFSDILVAAFKHSPSQLFEGSVFVHLGNGGLNLGDGTPGIPLQPLQAVSFGGQPLSLLGATPGWFEAALNLHSPAGRTGVQLEVEVKPLGQDFDGLGTLTSFFSDNVFTPRDALNFPLVAGMNEHWRARLRSASPLFGRSRWVSLPGNAPRELDVLVVPEPGAALGLASGAAALVLLARRRATRARTARRVNA